MNVARGKKRAAAVQRCSSAKNALQNEALQKRTMYTVEVRTRVSTVRVGRFLRNFEKFMGGNIHLNAAARHA